MRNNLASNPIHNLLLTYKLVQDTTIVVVRSTKREVLDILIFGRCVGGEHPAGICMYVRGVGGDFWVDTAPIWLPLITKIREKCGDIFVV